MGNLPFRRMFAYTFAVVFGATVCGFAAGAAAPNLHVDRFAAQMLVTGSVLVVLGFFLIRWWLGVARAAGVPLVVTSKRNAFLYGSLLILIVAGGAVLVYFAYAATGSRLAEAAVSLFLVVPTAFAAARASYAHMRAPLPQEAPSLRMSALLQPLLSVVFAANLILQLRARNVYLDMRVHEATIAMYFIVIPIFPLVSYFAWQRYARARETGASLAS